MSGACEVYFKQELIQVIPVSLAKITIGRNHVNVIHLPHPNISRDHGVITLADNLYYEDYSSVGTFVNGTLVKASKIAIHHGDVIELADFRIVYNARSTRSDAHKTSAVPTQEISHCELVVTLSDASQKKYPLAAENITFGSDQTNTVICPEAAPRGLTILTLKDGVFLYVEDKNAYSDGKRLSRGIVKFPAEGRVTYCGLKLELASTAERAQLIGSSSLMVEVSRQVQLAATRLKNLTVLISGESGTGKELAARLIHDLSERRSQNFVAVNCTAIPETLAESLLFGHSAGSFTDASRDHAGYFQNADGGTLFLDEIGDLPHAIQVKLLRAIETQEIHPVGAAKPKKINVRVVSGTNQTIKKPQTRLKLGFRDDLYYRLAGVEIELPPLREHKEDISELIAHFHSELAAQEPVLAQVTFSMNALTEAHAYDWPGNVRELRHVIHKAVLLTDSIVQHLPLTHLSLGDFSSEEREQAVSQMVNRGVKNDDVMRTFGLARSTYFRLKKKVSKVPLG